MGSRQSMGLLVLKTFHLLQAQMIEKSLWATILSVSAWVYMLSFSNSSFLHVDTLSDETEIIRLMFTYSGIHSGVERVIEASIPLPIHDDAYQVNWRILSLYFCHMTCCPACLPTEKVYVLMGSKYRYLSVSVHPPTNLQLPHRVA